MEIGEICFENLLTGFYMMVRFSGGFQMGRNELMHIGDNFFSSPLITYLDICIFRYTSKFHFATKANR